MPQNHSNRGVHRQSRSLKEVEVVAVAGSPAQALQHLQGASRVRGALGHALYQPTTPLPVLLVVDRLLDIAGRWARDTCPGADVVFAGRGTGLERLDQTHRRRRSLVRLP